jgi:hypothetical protein
MIPSAVAAGIQSNLMVKKIVMLIEGTLYFCNDNIPTYQRQMHNGRNNMNNFLNDNDLHI